MLLRIVTTFAVATARRENDWFSFGERRSVCVLNHLTFDDKQATRHLSCLRVSMVNLAKLKINSAGDSLSKNG